MVETLHRPAEVRAQQRDRGVRVLQGRGKTVGEGDLAVGDGGGWGVVEDGLGGDEGGVGGPGGGVWGDGAEEEVDEEGAGEGGSVFFGKGLVGVFFLALGGRLTLGRGC